MIIDENMPRRFVAHFATRVKVVAYAGEGELKGAANGELWRLAIRKKALLVTQDRGFRRRYSYHGKTEAGIILLALRNQTAPSLIGAFQGFLDNRKWEMEHLVGRLVIISEKGAVVRSGTPHGQD